MIAAVSSGLVMGFSAGIGCMATCVPMIIPYTATAENPSMLRGAGSTALFSIGRLIACAGLLAVFIAVRESLTLSQGVIAAATMISGLILTGSGLTVLGVFRRSAGLGRIVCHQMSGARSPLYLGILAGIKPCGPLMAAMAFMLTLPGVGEMSIFLLFFWLASSILLIVVGAAGGGLSIALGKYIGIERIRRIAGIAMLIIGLFLLLQGVGLLI